MESIGKKYCILTFKKKNNYIYKYKFYFLITFIIAVCWGTKSTCSINWIHYELFQKMKCTVYHVIVTIVWFNNVPFITESEYQFCKVYIYGLFTCCINRTDKIDGWLQVADACLLSQLVADWPHVNCQLIVPSKKQCLLGSKWVIVNKTFSF